MERRFEDCLVASITDDEFDVDRFFDLWFGSNNNAYYFLFKKNLSITNIQYNELLSLVVQHYSEIKKSNTIHNSAKKDLLFYDIDELKRTINNVIKELLRIPGKNKQQISQLARRVYRDLFMRTAAVKLFHNSCIIRMPSHLSVNLAAICGEAGYVHSCGYEVFHAEFSIANKVDLFDRLSKYLQTTNFDKKHRLVPYAHEDFSEDDAKRLYLRDALAKGLENVKLRISKLSMGDQNLVDVLRELQKTFSDQIALVRRSESDSETNIERSRTLWLISDSGVDSENIRQPSSDLFYISYDQVYKNESPFFLFDEDKPGWKSHTTTPHTLVGAMLNVTKPWRGKVNIFDPFVSTGTTLFESLRHADAFASGGDIDPFAKIIIQDNFEFFAMNVDELKNIIFIMKKIGNLVASSNYQLEKLDINGVSAAISRLDVTPGQVDRNLFDKFLELIEKTSVLWTYSDLTSDGENIPEAVQEYVRSLDLTWRIIYYIILKARNRYALSIGWGSTAGAEAFRRSLALTMDLISESIVWKEQIDQPTHVESELVAFPGVYSLSVSIADEKILNAKINVFNQVKPVSALDIGCNKYDIIIADPPYGFNTTEQIEGLVELYAGMIPSFIDALRPNGQLIMCLPMRSFTGKNIPIFVRSDFVVSQIVASSISKGRKALNVGRMRPGPTGLFGAPYYWFAGKTLGRDIVHFRFE